MKHYIIYTTRLIHTGTQTSGSSFHYLKQWFWTFSLPCLP